MKMDNQISLFDGVFDSLEMAKNEITTNKQNLINDLESKIKWIEKQKFLLAAAQSGKIIRNFNLINFISLNENFRILDFGGGIGWGFHITTQYCDNLIYYILDTSESNDTFEIFWSKNKKKPLFISDYKNIKHDIDIIYVNSVLQYLENIEEFFDLIRFLSPKKIVLDEVVYSTSQEFYTLQNHWNTKIPYRFISLSYLIENIKNLGYEILSKELSPINLPNNVSWNIKVSSVEVIEPKFPLNIVFDKK